jgi:hypothetical protein
LSPCQQFIHTRRLVLDGLAGPTEAGPRAGTGPANGLGVIVLQRIGDIWSGWNGAGGRAGGGVDKVDDWQSAAASTAVLCSAKCGCTGAPCGATWGTGTGTAVDGRIRNGGDDKADGLPGTPEAVATVGPVRQRLAEHADAGMSTVEYAVGTVVAAAFAAVLYKIVTGDSVVAGLTNLINSALSTTF